MGQVAVYCAHVWVPYVADTQNGHGGLPYEFCHRCRTTYLPGGGLVRKPVIIGTIDIPGV